jgi:GntR family transcriptional regulator
VITLSAPEAPTPRVARCPAYLRIRDELLELIRCGTYRPFDRLPSEMDLMRRFDVSRVTVRQALEALRTQGIVQSLQGKGSFVCMPKVVHETPALLGFHEAMEGRGYATGSTVLSVRERSACHETAQALQLKRKAAVLEVRRLRCVNGEPVSLDVSHFPIEIGAKLLSEDLTGDIFPLLERRCSVPLGRADLSIEAVPCDAENAPVLQLQPQAPVLHIRRLTWSTHGRPVDYEHLYCRGDACQYRVQLNRRRT